MLFWCVKLTHSFNFIAAAFDLHDGERASAHVYLTTTGEIVYGGPRRDRMISTYSVLAFVCIGYVSVFIWYSHNVFTVRLVIFEGG